MNGIIYKTTNLINGKIYIGQTTKENPNYLGSGNYISNSIQKHGKENFKRETLKENIGCKTALNIFEKIFINKLNSTNPEVGYNILSGGEGVPKGYKHSKESKVFSKERNQKIRLAIQNKPEEKKENWKQIIKKLNSKPVIQLDPITLEEIQEFNSIGEADKKFKCDVGQCVTGNSLLAGGYKWKYKNQPTPKFQPKWVPKRVLQLDPTTNQIVKVWDYFQQIFNELGWEINEANFKRKKSYGYRWCYEKDYLNK